MQLLHQGALVTELHPDMLTKTEYIYMYLNLSNATQMGILRM
jgi:hypothetical protein